MRAVDLEHHRGQWIAVAPDDGTVVAEAETLDGLHAALDEVSARPVVIQRVPTIDDPLFVGLD